MKAFHKKRAGTASLYVLAALVLISVYSSLILNMLKQDIYQINAYSLQMQAYYLANEAASATVSAMLMDDDDALIYKSASYFPMYDTIEHYSSTKIMYYHIEGVNPIFADPTVVNPDIEEGTQESQYIGISEITVSKEQHLYYGDYKDWLVIRVTSTIPDTRAERAGEDFSYSTITMVLVDNPLVQIYNMDPDNM